MSYDLSVASRFALPQFTSEPVSSTSEEEIAGAVGLLDGLASALGSVVDGVVFSDTPTASTTALGVVEDGVIFTDTQDGEAFSKSDYRHIESTVILDDAIELVCIMD